MFIKTPLCHSFSNLETLEPYSPTRFALFLILLLSSFLGKPIEIKEYPHLVDIETAKRYLIPFGVPLRILTVKTLFLLLFFSFPKQKARRRTPQKRFSSSLGRKDLPCYDSKPRKDRGSDDFAHRKSLALFYLAVSKLIQQQIAVSDRQTKLLYPREGIGVEFVNHISPAGVRRKNLQNQSRGSLNHPWLVVFSSISQTMRRSGCITSGSLLSFSKGKHQTAHKEPYILSP